MTRFLLELAEDARASVYDTYLSHAQLQDADQANLGRLERGRQQFVLCAVQLGPQSLQLAARGTYLRIVSIVESYVDSCLACLWRRERLSRDALFSRAADVAEEKAYNNWPERKESLTKYHNIGVGSIPQYSSMIAAVGVRNAIAHGTGHLTPRQRNAKDRGSIRQVGVSIVDNWVVVTDESLNRLVTISVNFIEQLDDLMQHQEPIR